jgi:DNA-binding MarR family transcriptional regulator
MVAPRNRLADEEYARLLTFRVGLRRFLQWSAEHAATVGLTPAQHQLLLAIRGHPDSRGPSVRELADYLCTRHHSVVQLIDRAEQLGLITRNREDRGDRRLVRLTLTGVGEEKLILLSSAHREELQRLASLLTTFLNPATAVPEK